MRVVLQRAPFDHPQLFVPNGHPMGHDGRPRVNDEGVARDTMLEIREVGRLGGTVAKRVPRIDPQPGTRAVALSGGGSIPPARTLI